MLAFDFDDQQLEQIADEYAATPRQVDLSRGRALKRTAGTIRRISSTGLRTELGLRNATALRRRIKEYRVGKGKDALKLWYGANDLPASAFKRHLRNGPEFGIFRNLVVRLGPLSFQRTQSV